MGILFGRSHINPLETYSLRFFMNSSDDECETKLNDKTKRKIQTTISRKLQSIDALWDAHLKLTDCKILTNINNDSQSNEYLNDANFSVKHNMKFRSPSKRKLNKKKKKKGNLYLMNFWNKNTTKLLATNMNKSDDGKVDKNKENVTPSIFVHEIENIMNGKNGDDDDDRTWFSSNFSFK